jgi:FtsH-binding integral membrane protein
MILIDTDNIYQYPSIYKYPNINKYLSIYQYLPSIYLYILNILRSPRKKRVKVRWILIII